MSKIVRVNNVARPPLPYLFRSPSLILQKWSINDLGCAIGRMATKKARHVVQRRAQVEFSRSQLFLRPFSIIDVEHHAIPIGDPTFRVEERLSDGLNPSILTIRPPE